MASKASEWKFNRIMKNKVEDKGKPFKPAKFRAFIGEGDFYDSTDVYYICYNKLVAYPLLKIRPNTVPPYHFTVYVNGNFKMEDYGTERLEGLIQKAYESRLPQKAFEGLKVNVFEEMYFLRVEIEIDF